MTHRAATGSFTVLATTLWPDARLPWPRRRHSPPPWRRPRVKSWRSSRLLLPPRVGGRGDVGVVDGDNSPTPAGDFDPDRSECGVFILLLRSRGVAALVEMALAAGVLLRSQVLLPTFLRLLPVAVAAPADAGKAILPCSSTAWHQVSHLASGTHAPGLGSSVPREPGPRRTLRSRIRWYIPIASGPNGTYKISLVQDPWIPRGF
jgi:hypothetical protein